MPPEIFEFPTTRDQDAVNNAKPTEENGWVTITRVEYDKGIRVYVKEHPFPHKGMPTMEAIHAINQVKLLLKSFLRLFRGWRCLLIPFLGFKRILASFCETSEGFLRPYILKYEFMTNTAQGMYDLSTYFLSHFSIPEDDIIRIGRIVATLVEYDSAYRFRLMDLCHATTKEQLIENPRKEIKRLIALNRERDYAEITNKLEMGVNLISYALVIPKVKRAFRIAVQSTDWNKLIFDETDMFWTKIKRDYKFFGKTHEERNI